MHVCRSPLLLLHALLSFCQESKEKAASADSKLEGISVQITLKGCICFIYWRKIDIHTESFLLPLLTIITIINFIFFSGNSHKRKCWFWHSLVAFSLQKEWISGTEFKFRRSSGVFEFKGITKRLNNHSQWTKKDGDVIIVGEPEMSSTFHCHECNY